MSIVSQEIVVLIDSATRLRLKRETEGGVWRGFVINLEHMIGDEWHEIYRADTRHGYLHEQRFWESPDPIPLDRCKGLDLQTAFEVIFNAVKANHGRWIMLYKERGGKQ